MTAPIYFTVTANHTVEFDAWSSEIENVTLHSSASGEALDNAKTGAIAEVTISAVASSGEMSMDVVNESGELLPGTGGTGTKVLYLIGVVLVLGAAVVLVTRRRAR